MTGSLQQVIQREQRLRSPQSVAGEPGMPSKHGWRWRHSKPGTTAKATIPARVPCACCAQGWNGEGVARRMQALVPALVPTAHELACNLTWFSSSLFHLPFPSACKLAFRAYWTPSRPFLFQLFIMLCEPICHRMFTLLLSMVEVTFVFSSFYCIFGERRRKKSSAWSCGTLTCHAIKR